MSCGTATSTSTEPDGSLSNPFVIKQGRTFSLVLTVTRNGSTVDLSGRTGRAQLRAQVDSLGTPIATFEVTIRTPQTGSNRGKVDVTLGATVTAAPQIAPGRYYFDVELALDADDDDVIATGVYVATVTPEVTK